MIQEVDTIVCRCTWNCFRIELMSSLNRRAKLFIVDLRISQQHSKSAHFVVTEVALVLVDTYAYDHIDSKALTCLHCLLGRLTGPGLCMMLGSNKIWEQIRHPGNTIAMVTTSTTKSSITGTAQREDCAPDTDQRRGGICEPPIPPPPSSVHQGLGDFMHST